MKKIISTLFIMCIILLSSCGESYNVKGQVKDFMNEQMNLNDYDILAWSQIDSTSHVKDSMIQVMHASALKDKTVKKGTSYAPRTLKLNLITVRYRTGKDTLMSTFYLDDKLSGIVCVKTNGQRK